MRGQVHKPSSGIGTGEAEGEGTIRSVGKNITWSFPGVACEPKQVNARKRDPTASDLSMSFRSLVFHTNQTLSHKWRLYLTFDLNLLS